MADLVKKIKIKKQDGTFTDYIPIGAESGNVTDRQGYSLQEVIGDIDVENDGSVSDRLEEIESKVDDICYFIFPKFIPEAWGGDCNLIKYGDKNILIDTHSVEYWDYINQMMEDNNVEHIDYFILTHYHADHMGNIENLVEAGLIDSNTRLFFPAETTHVDWSTSITKYKNLCTQYNLTYYVPYENEVVRIGKSLKITFTNCNATAMDAYYANSTDGNADSIICLIEHNNIKTLYTGDANNLTVKRLMELDFVKSQIDLLKLPHHGIDNRSCWWYKHMSPTYAIHTSGRLYDARNESAWNGDPGFLNHLGAKVFAQQWQDDYIKFVSDGYSIINLLGKVYNPSMGRYEMTVYVDINSDLDFIPDGTQEKPFHEIMEAIAWISNMPYGQYYIDLAPGEYAYSDHWALTHGKNKVTIDIPHQIVIEGQNADARDTTIINGVYLQNAHVHLRNVSIDASNRNEAVYIRNGFVECDNVKFYSRGTRKGGIYVRSATAYCVDCYFNDLTRCFEGNTGGSVISHHSTIGSITNNRKLMNYRTRIGFIQETDTVFETESDKYVLNNMTQYDKYSKPVLLYSNQEKEFSSTEIDLSNFNIEDFFELRVDYLDNGLLLGTTGWVNFDAPTRWFPISMTTGSASGDKIYEKGVILQFKEGKLKYIQPYTKTIDTSDGSMVCTTNRGLFVSQVWGRLKNDYQYVDLHSNSEPGSI